MSDRPHEEDTEELRSRAIALHGELRVELRNALHLATRVDRGDRNAIEALGQVADELVGLTHRHISFERERLGPFLEGANAWGPERARLLVEIERQQQDEALSAAAALVAALSRPESLVVATRRLARAVLRAMRLEERELLRSDVMREEVVVSDQSTG